MSVWEPGVMTEKGNALLTKLHSGTTLSITRAVAGAGSVTSDEMRSLTSIPDERQEMTFSTKSYPVENQCAVPLKLTSTGVTEGYKATAIGIYAFDPDEGEILYMAAKAVEGKELDVPSEAEHSAFSAVWTFYVKYGQADGVTITVDPSNSVTMADLEQALNNVAFETITTDQIDTLFSKYIT